MVYHFRPQPMLDITKLVKLFSHSSNAVTHFAQRVVVLSFNKIHTEYLIRLVRQWVCNYERLQTFMDVRLHRISHGIRTRRTDNTAH